MAPEVLEDLGSEDDDPAGYGDGPENTLERSYSKRERELVEAVGEWEGVAMTNPQMPLRASMSRLRPDAGGAMIDGGVVVILLYDLYERIAWRMLSP